MSHNILKHDKQQGTKQAWHGLTEVKEQITLQDNWLRQWEIEEQALFFDNGERSGFSILGCSDNELCKIGKPYNPNTFKPINNADFLELVRGCVADSNHSIESVGSVKNRGRVFLSLKIAGLDDFHAAGRDFAPYLNFGNGHDKSSVLWVNTSNICTVCDNTFNANLFTKEDKESDNVSIRVRHTKNAKMRFPNISELVEKAIGEQTRFKTELENLAKKPLSINQARCWFAGFQGQKVSIEKAAKEKEKKGIVFSSRSLNTNKRLVELFYGGRGNNGETYADAFSSLTDYYTHENSGGIKSAQRQFESSEYGNGAERKKHAFSLMVAEESRMSTLNHGRKLLELHEA